MRKAKGGFFLIKEARGFGATVDEARENALLNLNVSELEDIQFEIISLPKKKVLGVFGGSMAEVKAYIEIADKKQKPSSGKAPSKKKKVEAKKVDNKEASAKVESVKAEKIEKEPTVSDFGEAVSADEIPSDSNIGKAVSYIKTILNAFECKDIDIKVASKENASRILLNGDDVSVIIGRRGETLDAIQYLSSLAANNGGGHYKISINIGNYRERREETLINLANRISAQVLKTGKSRALEHMNPYERRIIHTAVQNIDGVVSNSFGEGKARRIVISLEGVEVKPPRNHDRRRNSNQRKSNSSVVSAPSREPKKDSDIPLYGKIN